jgi:hypothetical protein
MITLGAGSSLVADAPGSFILGSSLTLQADGAGASFVNNGGLQIADGRTLFVDSSIDSFENNADLSLVGRSINSSSGSGQNTANISIGAGGLFRSSGNGFVNEGVIEQTAGSLQLAGAWVNQGTIMQTGGSTLLAGNWQNEGMISIAGGSLSISGLTTAGLDSIERTGGTMSISGTWDGSNTVTDLGAYGNFIFNGTFRGGEFINTDGSNVTFLESVRSLDGTRIAAEVLQLGPFTSTLDVRNAPAITGDLRMPGGAIIAQNSQTVETMDLSAGMRPDGTIVSSITTILPDGHDLSFGPDVRIDAYADVRFGATSISAPRGSIDFGGEFITIGDDIEFRGQFLDVFENSGTIETSRFYQGNIEAFHNSGVLRMTPGSVLRLTNQWSNSGAIILDADTDAIFGGDFSVDDIANVVTNGADARWGGRITLGSPGLHLGADWDSGVLGGATLRDGLLSVEGNLADYLYNPSTQSGSRAITLRDVILGSDVQFVAGSTGDLTLESVLDLGKSSFYTEVDEVELDATTIRNGILIVRSADMTVRDTVTIESDALLAFEYARFTNYPTGTVLNNSGILRIQAGQNSGPVAETIVNNGLIEVSGTREVELGATAFENNGTVSVQGTTATIHQGLFGVGNIAVTDGQLRLETFTTAPDMARIALNNSDLDFVYHDIDLGGAELDLRSVDGATQFTLGAIRNGTLRADGTIVRAREAELDVSILGGDLSINGDVQLGESFSLPDGDVRFESAEFLSFANGDPRGGQFDIFGNGFRVGLAVGAVAGFDSGRLIEGAGLRILNISGNQFPVHFTNDGTIRILGSTSTSGFDLFSVGGVPNNLTLLNNGLIDIRNGAKLEVQDPAQYLENFDGTVLSGGSWRVETGGNIDLIGASVRVNDATVTLFGVASSFDALHALEENRGTLNLMNGRSLNLDRAFTNTGTVRVERGILSVDELTVTEDATIRLTLASGARGVAWGAIDVDGAATISGLLRIDLASALTPMWGLSFDIIRANTLSGDFDAFDLPELSDDLRWYTSIESGDYLLGVRDVADANADGVVDFADLNAVLSDYGVAGSGLLGDVDTNGIVDFADLNAVLGRFGAAAPRAVPAPTGAGLLAIAGGALLRRRRNRRVG